jgi:extradiol dioxygenase family protein
VEPPTTSYVGQPHEQIKLIIADPSGNLIELKAYRNPELVLTGIEHA